MTDETPGDFLRAFLAPLAGWTVLDWPEDWGAAQHASGLRLSLQPSATGGEGLWDAFLCLPGHTLGMALERPTMERAVRHAFDQGMPSAEALTAARAALEPEPVTTNPHAPQGAA